MINHAYSFLVPCSELEADVFGNEVYASSCHMNVSTVPSLSLAGGSDDKTEVSWGLELQQFCASL